MVDAQLDCGVQLAIWVVPVDCPQRRVFPAKHIWVGNLGARLLACHEIKFGKITSALHCKFVSVSQNKTRGVPRLSSVFSCAAASTSAASTLKTLNRDGVETAARTGTAEHFPMLFDACGTE